MRFRDLAGQEEAIGQIGAAVTAGRIPHAFLFHGRLGTGKTTAALALARLLQCRAPVGLDPCEACPSCLKSLHFNHPDIVLLPPTPSAPDTQAGEGQRLEWIASVQSEFTRPGITRLDESRPLEHRIATMRWLKQEASRAAVDGGWKFFILKRAGQLNNEAANAILKLLEEPNPGTILVLGVARPSDVPDTIRSRCALVRFHDLPVAEVERLLEARVTPEKKTPIEISHLRLAARVARGSLTRGAQLLDEDVLALRDEAAAFVSSPAGNPDLHERLEPWLRSRDRGRLELLLDLMLLWYGDLLRVRLGAVDPRDGLVNDDRREELVRQASRIDFEAISRSVNAVQQAGFAIEGNGYISLVLPAMLESLARVPVAAT